MLETEIKKLTTAVENLTIAMNGKDTVAAAQSEKTAPVAKKEEAAQASPAAATPSLDDALAITPDDKPTEGLLPETTATPAVATKDEVIQATIKLAKEKGRSAPVPIFATFGIKKATECPEAKYGELVAALVAALK